MRKSIALLFILFTIFNCKSQSKESKEILTKTNIIHTAESDLSKSITLDNNRNTKPIVNKMVEYARNKSNTNIPKGTYTNLNKKTYLLACINSRNTDNVIIFVFDEKIKYLRKHKLKYSEFLKIKS